MTKADLLKEMGVILEYNMTQYCIDVFVQAYTPKPEKISNPFENVEAKMKYYDEAYNDDLSLKANPEIRIVKFNIRDTRHQKGGL